MPRNLHLLSTFLLAFFASLSAHAVPAPGEGFADVPGGRVWYRVIGNGSQTPVLLVHGGPGATSCYLTQLAVALATDRPVVLYDQLGSGRSDRPTDGSLWRLDRFVSELAALRAALGLHSVHLLGHSWGGALVVEYLRTHQPAGVVSTTFASPLISTPRWVADANRLRAKLPPHARRLLAKHEQAGTLDSDEYRTATDLFYDRFVFRHQPRPEEAECANSPGNTTIYNVMWGATEFNPTGSLRDFERTEALSGLRMPVLFIGGRHDEATPETLAEFHRLTPVSELVILEDSAHVGMQDEPQRFVAAMRRFIRKAELGYELPPWFTDRRTIP